MSRRVRGSQVRGPNSALTEFLREQGISAEEIRTRYERRQQEAAAAAPATTEPDETPEPAAATASDSDSELEIRLAAREKRRRAGHVDSDSDADYESDSTPAVRFGDTATCPSCATEFTLTVSALYSTAHSAYLCADCQALAQRHAQAQRKSQMAARKRRQKMATALLDRADWKATPKLADLCILEISRHIEDVDQLGDIGAVNLDKLLRILLRNRRLDDTTVRLFLDPRHAELEFWDCSSILADGLAQVAAVCPQLQRLTLAMCGQLHNRTLEYYADQLSSLTHLRLDGPFLVSDPQWKALFTLVGTRLKGFHLGNTHRFLTSLLVHMLELCPQLEELSLSRLDGLDSEAGYALIPTQLTQLTQLEVLYPHDETLVSDDWVVAMCTSNPGIRSLTLDGCTGLTDECIHGLAFLDQLQTVSLRGLDQLTDEGFAALWNGWQNPGLLGVDFQKCIGLGDRVVGALLSHSAGTLVEALLNSVYGVTKQALMETPLLPLLTRLDLGFVRTVDDAVVARLGESCPLLELLEVYGDPGVTRMAKVRDGVRLVGRQSDSI